MSCRSYVRILSSQRRCLACSLCVCADDEFCTFQSSYLSAHCSEFDSSEENKLSYTPLFDEYVSRMEGFITQYLHRRLSDFDMESFLGECEARGEEQLAGDVFDVLTSMSDFEAFKELMIAQKEQQKWKTTSNSSASAGQTATAPASAPSAKPEQ